MRTGTTVKTISFSAAMHHVNSGGAFVDLRPVDQYLDVHIPGSLSLVYEAGPGLPSRARDCIPLGTTLVLLDLGAGDLTGAAAALRGKGYEVAGVIEDGINEWSRWHGNPASTERLSPPAPPGAVVLDVADPGAQVPDGATRIAVEELWRRAGTLGSPSRVLVASGRGVRAALAVGICERAGVKDVALLQTGS